MKTVVRIVSLIIFIAAIAAIFLYKGGKKVADDTPPPVRPVKSKVVGAPEVMTTLRFPGVVDANAGVDLSFEVSGRIVEFPAARGQHVRKGDILARQEVAEAIKTATDGTSIGTWLEGDESIEIRLRAPESETSDPDSLMSAWFRPDSLSKSIPLMQVLSGFENVSEDAIIHRRNRLLCLTVKANPGLGDNANAALSRLRPRIEKLAKTFPEGYRAEWGGEQENSGDANRSLAAKVPSIVAIMFLITVFLFDSIKKPLVIFCTVLGMLPLIADPFYAAMAVTVMCGLGFATLLTLVVIPVNYALFFRLPTPEK